MKYYILQGSESLGLKVNGYVQWAKSEKGFWFIRSHKTVAEIQNEIGGVDLFQIQQVDPFWRRVSLNDCEIHWVLHR